MLALIVFLVAQASSPAETVSNEMLNTVSHSIPLDILELKETYRDEAVGVQMRELTIPLLGMEYVIDAAGEGKSPDTDPLVRYDAFDCLTFVEEALALAIGENLDEVDKIRKGLRYKDDIIDYNQRNHFMLSQWIPNAIEKGYLIDITHTIGETHFVSKTISRQTWSRWRGRHKYPFAIDNYPTGSYRMGVLSLDSAIDNLHKIPEGSLVVVVRQNKDYNPLLITHLGFVVKYSDTDIRIRHATKMAGGTVKDNYLSWYLDYIRYYNRWPVEGVLILEPQTPQEPELLYPDY